MNGFQVHSSLLTHPKLSHRYEEDPILSHIGRRSYLISQTVAKGVLGMKANTPLRLSYGSFYRILAISSVVPDAYIQHGNMHCHFLKSTCDIEPSHMRMKIRWSMSYNCQVTWGHPKGSIGHGSFSDRGKCHFLNLTCYMGHSPPLSSGLRSLSLSMAVPLDPLDPFTPRPHHSLYPCVLTAYEFTHITPLSTVMIEP